jgi:hypothetical protein
MTYYVVIMARLLSFVPPSSTTVRAFLAALLMAAALPGCAEDATSPADNSGEDWPDPLPAEPGTPQCGAEGNGLMLVGKVGSRTISISHDSVTGGFEQYDEGELLQPDPSDEEYASYTQVHLSWETQIWAGHAERGTGNIRFGEDSPEPGLRICSSNVSIHMRTQAEESSYGSVTYTLDELLTGPNCDEPIEGQLIGCMD